MSFKNIDDDDIAAFSRILGPGRVLTDEENRQKNSHDQTEDLSLYPDVVLLPRNTEDIRQVMAYCYERHIAVTPKGAGTGLSGGAIPVWGGVSLDMRCLNKIIRIDTDNFQVVTEPGVITEVLQNEVAGKGLFYPVDPASRGSCFIGGNVAESSGGPKAVKYGTVKDYVLNLKAVLPDGRLIETGANTLKNATGYDLTRLLVGSEGTLAVITEITIKLLPLPERRLLILAAFNSAENACRAVNAILNAGIIPSALEFMEKDALVCAQQYLGESPVSVPDEVQAHLLIEVDGWDMDMLLKQAEAIAEALRPLTDEDMLLAEDGQQQEVLWKLRRVVGEAAKKSSIYKEEDTVVPRACLPELLAYVKAVGKKYGFRSICYGHAGDGNLHVNILKEGLSDREWREEIPKAIREIFVFVKQKGGTISGEHGIGYVQKEYMDIAFPAQTLSLMKSIKHVFDPKGILNPGKIFPEETDQIPGAGSDRCID
ncbi:MAG TPA: FAD-linked oxidase C-terminal domain-containing protein [Edaphocola sp.]|nr:FAD-linked oxidase C-terminal domain-containing protein [Edaphocola sp.]